MYRQQVLKCRLGDRLVTGSDRFEKKLSPKKVSVYAGFSKVVTEVTAFFKS